MATHKLHTERNFFYFVTFTCYKWLPLFERTKLQPFFKKSFLKMREKGVLSTGFVIMPNHAHLLLYNSDQSTGLNGCLSETKRFLAYEIVKRLKKQSHHELLAVLSSGVRENELKKGKKHQVFRLSFDGLVVKGEKEINRVLDYIHFNPVRGKWRLVEDYVEYPYSSAGFYELGRPNEFGIVDYRSILYPETDQRLLLSRTLGVRTQSPLASDSEPEEKPRRMPDI